ncbi:MAG TPA: transketolase [Candidatus Acidoferrales bacterium]|nr:transketolase [Candidatus Acidoferrales bacterium]
MANSTDDDKRINTIRMLSIDAVQKANSGHPGMPLGAAAQAYTIWAKHLRHDPAEPTWINRDRFVLSAGHGSMLLYSLLFLTGYLTIDDIKNFRVFGSRTPGHPESHLTPGVDATTGPLGQGISTAVGMAIAEAHLGAVYNREETIIDHFTYVIAGDGDMMEGVSSEAGSLAGHLKLGKLIVLYDDNRVSLAAPTDVTFTENVLERYEAYGWHVQHLDESRSNDVLALDEAITAAKNVIDRPSLISVRSHIGLGSPRQDTFAAHGEPLGAENVKKTKEFFGWPLEPDFYVPDDVLAFFRQTAKHGAEVHAAWKQAYAKWQSTHPDLAAQFERARNRRLPANLPWPAFNAENGSVATRDAGGTVMNAIAGAFPDLVGGSADLDPSTKTYLKGQGDFSAGNRAGRNIHFGVREHAMGAAANGIALHGGLLPYTATFFNFVDYMKPAVRIAALSYLHVIFVFTHDSIYLGEDGPTHEPVEQLATLRATPNLTVIRPADSLETLEAWKVALEPTQTPVALVLSRQKLPYLGDRTADVGRGGYVVYGGGPNDDVVLIGSGSEVSLAIEAAKLLEAEGTRVRVVSLPSWELFAAQSQAYRDEVIPPRIRARVSVEAGATLGWERWIGEHGVAIGLDQYGASGRGEVVAKNLGFNAQHVAETASGLLAKT